MSAPARVLVVDDDERVRTLLTWKLEDEGYTVLVAEDGAAALERIAADRPDLVVLDLSLPRVAGLDVLRRVRDDDGDATAVIILSGRDGEADRVTGLDLGADDYLVKPFSPAELAARVRSVLRRARPPSAAPSAAADPAAVRTRPAAPDAGVRVDADAHEVFVDGRPVELTAREFDLLAFLVANPRQVFRRSVLLQRVWASDAGWQSEATVTEHVHRIRHKVEPDPARPRWLRTVRGVGYRYEP